MEEQMDKKCLNCNGEFDIKGRIDYCIDGCETICCFDCRTCHFIDGDRLKIGHNKNCKFIRCIKCKKLLEDDVPVKGAFEKKLEEKCPKCSHKLYQNGWIANCNNGCGTIVCDNCNSHLFYDNNRLKAGHVKSCGIYVCSKCNEPRNIGNHDTCRSYENAMEHKWREFFPKVF